MEIKNLFLPGAQGKPISIDVCYKEKVTKQPVVIYAHGFNGFKDWGGFNIITEELVEAGLIVVKFNFSHNGTSPEKPDEFVDLEAFGNNNYSYQLTDMQLVTEWICDVANPLAAMMDTEAIYLIGHSMGGGIAILFASEDCRIKKLVTWAAISECKTPWGNWPLHTMKEWLEKGVQYYTNTRTNQQLPLYYQLYMDYVENEERLNIQNAIKMVSIPILICHGTIDLSVPLENAYHLKEWQPAAELFTVETNHVFDRVHPWVKPYLPEAMDMVVQKTIAFLK